MTDESVEATVVTPVKVKKAKQPGDKVGAGEKTRPKTNKEFASEVPADIYIVYSSGKWRVYRNSVHAHKRYAALKKGNRQAKLLKYSVLEILRE